MYFQIFILLLLLIPFMVQSMSGTGYIVLLRSKETAIDPYLAIEKEMRRGNQKEKKTDRNKIIRKFQVGKVKGFHGVFGNELLEYLKRSGNVKKIEKNFFLRFEYPLAGLPKASMSSSGFRFKSENKESKTLTYSKVPTVYVVDSGIHLDHPEFEGRATLGTTTCHPCQEFDVDGHGTHVAGIIASKAFGVYPEVKLISVKVKEGGVGDVASLLQGLEWISRHVTTSREVVNPIINISLSTEVSTVLNQAVQDLIRNNITVVVSAGNSVEQACNRSPASARGVITVGAIDASNERANFSNHGPCLDVYAPGQDIRSTWHTHYTEVCSGTSMSAPYATAAAAFLLHQFPNSTPNRLKKLLLQYGTAGQVTGESNTDLAPFISMETLRVNLENKKNKKKKESSKYIQSKPKKLKESNVKDSNCVNSAEASSFNLTTQTKPKKANNPSKKSGKNTKEVSMENNYREKILKAFLFKSS